MVDPILTQSGFETGLYVGSPTSCFMRYSVYADQHARTILATEISPILKSNFKIKAEVPTVRFPNDLGNVNVADPLVLLGAYVVREKIDNGADLYLFNGTESLIPDYGFERVHKLLGNLQEMCSKGDVAFLMPIDKSLVAKEAEYRMMLAKSKPFPSLTGTRF